MKKTIKILKSLTKSWICCNKCRANKIKRNTKKIKQMKRLKRNAKKIKQMKRLKRNTKKIKQMIRLKRINF